jgi:amino acid adenylation domain-containing protein
MSWPTEALPVPRPAGSRSTGSRSNGLWTTGPPTTGPPATGSWATEPAPTRSGPAVPMPGRAGHELFEEHARRHPAATAARCGGRQWTYDELNRRANRIAWTLLAAGRSREDIVAVTAARNLNWLAAVLGILKAGCAYLPVDPTLPPARITAMLDRSGCQTILAGPGDDSGRPDDGRGGGLARALTVRPGITVLPVAAPPGRPGGSDDANPGLRVDAGQLAYVLFTSGSTGEPKGAMCEHAGMLNHLLAKIEDLGLDHGDVVAQTAPAGFDISLWQLLAPLLAGGQVEIVPPEVIEDVERLVAAMAAGRVTVAQFVPSYLELVVTHLEHTPNAWPGLRWMVATGDALQPELARRWFAVCPGVPLLNAYGLTETCDDTNHYVLTGPPDGGRVPLGRPVRNVTITVVDEDLRPVPPGTAGEIVMSGVCVGRGYVNDPERTRQAFLPDPAVPGGRRYRSGDIGRWRPDGSLEFLGRRDAQVKVRGFRIELGEVESGLLRVAGVRDAAVVATPDRGTGRRLAGFYTGPACPDAVRAALADVLPGYLIPDRLDTLPALPITGNGKVDRNALLALADEAGGGDRAAGPPQSGAERRLAAAWAQVLGLSAEGITRSDSFFRLGGTSLAAIRLVLQLDQAISVPDIVAHPVLADLAAVLDGAARTAAASLADAGSRA